MHRRWPVFLHSASQQVPRDNYGRGAVTSRSIFFALNPGRLADSHGPRKNSPTRSVRRFHVPRIWIGSINGSADGVKRKTQNVVDFFVACLFVVVVFLVQALTAALLAFFRNALNFPCKPSRLHLKPALTLLAVLGLLTATVPAPQKQPSSAPCAAENPSTFSFGEKMHIEGIHNAGKINEVLYRGAQPRKPGFAQLKKLGVTTIVNLRREDRSKINWERREVEELGMRFVHIPVGGWAPPSQEQVAEFLALFRNHPGEKIFVHCRFGDDRTGVLVATYRVAVERWSAEQAIKEMYFFGFNGFWHPAMKSFVDNFPRQWKSSPATSQP